MALFQGITQHLFETTIKPIIRLILNHLIFNYINDRLKELYYPSENTGSYCGVERLYRRAVEDVGDILPVTPSVIFYYNSGIHSQQTRKTALRS